MELIEKATTSDTFKTVENASDKEEKIVAKTDLETLRNKLQSDVKLASETIAGFWPMRTFVHHNPLHSLEYLPFHEAVSVGKKFLDGKGYLPNNIYRGYLKSGRIEHRHVDEVLKTRSLDKHITLGDREIKHIDVLRACLTADHSLYDDTQSDVKNYIEDSKDGLIKSLSEHISSTFPYPSASQKLQTTVSEDQASLAKTVTLSQWCDEVLGTEIVSQITSDLIDRCEAFLDEDYATWSMPGREKGLFASWKTILTHEWSSCGIEDSQKKIRHLSDDAEYVLIECLQEMAIPQQLWRDYLTLELGAMPGWAGYIKWRAKQKDYNWQRTFPVDLIQYLAIRLWYERELIKKFCQHYLGIEGKYTEILTFMQNHTREYYLRKERNLGRLPAAYAAEVDRLPQRKRAGWDEYFDLFWKNTNAYYESKYQESIAKRLYAFALAMELDPNSLLESAPADLKQLYEWIEGFPESDHGPLWLTAFEAGYHEMLLGKIIEAKNKTVDSSASENRLTTRPHTQSVYCIDVRSEPFRRHLESLGPNETYGFAGFFGVLIRYRVWEDERQTEQYPVIVFAKTEVKEIPRSYLEKMLPKYEHRSSMINVGHTLLHDLKQNAVTPFVMVEAVGWFYTVQMFGKTIIPRLYHRVSNWLQKVLIPTISTTITVSKPEATETEEMLKVKYDLIIYKILQEITGLSKWQVPRNLIDAIWKQVLNPGVTLESSLQETAKKAGLSSEMINAVIGRLQEHGITQSEFTRQKESLLQTGFSLEEQVTTVGTALRIMGLTSNFARLVLICGHGSDSDNNPYESALDCGACGGNEGKPNARVFVMMANNRKVREKLAQAENGIEIPVDTYFIAGQINTTTDEVELFDLEDAPSSHTLDIARLVEYLDEAGRRTSQERCSRFSDVPSPLPYNKAKSHVIERSADWSQVRPEWGLSSNTAFVIGRRSLTDSIDMRGRVFLHSYDHRFDTEFKFLEVLLTAPQVVAQWINMEHYFSTTDYNVYGSGSKIYHNVVGNFGVVAGPWSDLRLGLSWQTVMNGDVPYHEPMRLLTIVEAPRKAIENLIGKHQLLQHYYHNEWVHLVSVDPEDGNLYRYRSTGDWVKIDNSITKH